MPRYLTGKYLVRLMRTMNGRLQPLSPHHHQPTPIYNILKLNKLKFKKYISCIVVLLDIFKITNMRWLVRLGKVGHGCIFV